VRKSGPAKTRLDTDQHHANLAFGAARLLDHARGMRFRHLLHSLGSGRSATLSVTDNSRGRVGDRVSCTGKYGREWTQTPRRFSAIGVMRALNRHVERVFNLSRKDHHWDGGGRNVVTRADNSEKAQSAQHNHEGNEPEPRITARCPSRQRRGGI
jgi:hypothetical protein